MVVTTVMISYGFQTFEQFELHVDGYENCDDLLLFSDI